MNMVAYRKRRARGHWPGSRCLVLALSAALISLPAFAQAKDGETPDSRFEGIASWYGAAFHGRLTASGELFDKEGLTAAHRTLPFGTLLRVKNRGTGASVVVRVTDRGPFVGERVIDLSEGAARLIGLLATGTARVSCEVLPSAETAAFGPPTPPRPEASGRMGPAAGSATARIQVASYRDSANAQATAERLRMAGLAPVIEEAGEFRRVVFPAVPLLEAEALAERLRSLGYRDLLISGLRPQGK